jgi:ABC-type nitrate/sulfonate/bicarbonate transport system permease component
MNARLRPVLGIGTIVVLLAIWQLVAVTAKNTFFPSVSDIAATFVHEWFSPQFGAQAVPSLLRMFAGYVLAAILGIAIGIAIGASRTLFRVVDPFLQFLRAVPPTAIIPVGILLIGINDAMRVLVIAFGAMWPILVNSADGARGVPGERLESARNFGLTPFETLVGVTFPSALPAVFAGLRTGLAIAFIMIVVSEMIGSTNGLGYYILAAQRTFAIPQMYAGIVLLAILGYALNAGFSLVERRVLAWHFGQTARQA